MFLFVNYYYLLLLSILFAQTVNSNNHIAVMSWPISYGRRFTDTVFFRQLAPPQAAFFLPFRPAALADLDRWMMFSWLPANFSYTSYDVPVVWLEDKLIYKLHSDYGHFYLEPTLRASSINNNNNRQQVIDDLNRWYRGTWDPLHQHCGLSYPEEYFREGSSIARQLPLAEWLADAGIRPHNNRNYRRGRIIAALRPHLGGNELNFRLLCYNYNALETTPEHFRHQVRSNRRSTMLVSVLVCLHSDWQGQGPLIFAPCERLVPFPVWFDTCSEPQLKYYHTLLGRRNRQN